MATKVWTTTPAYPASEGAKPRQILGRYRSHRRATRISTIKGQWTTGDISVFGFILSLAFIGAILSAYSDRPAFWLLVGLGPVAIGFTLITFLRQRFGRRLFTPTTKM